MDELIAFKVVADALFVLACDCPKERYENQSHCDLLAALLW